MRFLLLSFGNVPFSLKSAQSDFAKTSTILSLNLPFKAIAFAALMTISLFRFNAHPSADLINVPGFNSSLCVCPVKFMVPVHTAVYNCRGLVLSCLQNF